MRRLWVEVDLMEATGNWFKGSEARDFVSSIDKVQEVNGIQYKVEQDDMCDIYLSMDNDEWYKRYVEV